MFKFNPNYHRIGNKECRKCEGSFVRYIKNGDCPICAQRISANKRAERKALREQV